MQIFFKTQAMPLTLAGLKEVQVNKNKSKQRIQSYVV